WWGCSCVWQIVAASGPIQSRMLEALAAPSRSPPASPGPLAGLRQVAAPALGVFPGSSAHRIDAPPVVDGVADGSRDRDDPEDQPESLGEERHHLPAEQQQQQRDGGEAKRPFRGADQKPL